MSAAAKSIRRSCVLGLTVIPAANCGLCCGQYNACPCSFGFACKDMRSSLPPVCTTKLRTEHPRLSSKYEIDAAAHLMLDRCSLYRCGAFPFAIYPRLSELVSRSRLVKFCVSWKGACDRAPPHIQRSIHRKICTAGREGRTNH